MRQKKGAFTTAGECWGKAHFLRNSKCWGKEPLYEHFFSAKKKALFLRIYSAFFSPYPSLFLRKKKSELKAPSLCRFFSALFWRIYSAFLRGFSKALFFRIKKRRLLGAGHPAFFPLFVPLFFRFRGRFFFFAVRRPRQTAKTRFI